MKIKISWKKIDNQINNLLDKIEKENFKPDCIIGIACGGLIPATLIAKKLNIKSLYSINASSYTNKTKGQVKVLHIPNILNAKNILIVDEIADTGDTLKKVLNKFKNKYKNLDIKTGTLFVNKNKCKYYPDYYLEKTNKWVIFPWDNQND